VLQAALFPESSNVFGNHSFSVQKRAVKHPGNNLTRLRAIQIHVFESIRPVNFLLQFFFSFFSTYFLYLNSALYTIRSSTAKRGSEHLIILRSVALYAAKC
jgi:hypothetical protein